MTPISLTNEWSDDKVAVGFYGQPDVSVRLSYLTSSPVVVHAEPLPDKARLM